jgi:hypothetical protein
VDGEITQTIFKFDGSVQWVSKSDFTVFVRDCAWLIRTANYDSSGKPVLVLETGCTNGAEVYELSSQPPGSRGHAALGPNMAKIIPSALPIGQTDDYVVCHLWLMYASGCYFGGLATNWVTPVYDLNASVVVHPELKREAKWDLCGGVGSLPLNITYFRQAGLPHATYTASGMTNAGEVLIPSGFVFEQRVGGNFAPGMGNTAETKASYRIRKLAIVHVTAVRPVCSRSDLAPEATDRTMVMDQRQASMTNKYPTQYDVQNGVEWVSVEKAKQLSAQQHAVSKAPHKATAVFYALLLSVSAVFLFFLSRLNPKRV